MISAKTKSGLVRLGGLKRGDKFVLDGSQEGEVRVPYNPDDPATGVGVRYLNGPSASKRTIFQSSYIMVKPLW